MNPSKRHIFVDSFPFEEPNRRVRPKKSTTPRRATIRNPKAKQKTTNRKKATPQPRTPKPRVEPTPAELEARQEKRREYERQRAQTPERKELMRRSTQERRDKAKLRGICVECGASPHPGRDPVPDLLQAPPGVPKAGQGESCPEKGAGLRSNPHLLTTTPVTGRGASSRPVTGADRDVLCVEGLKEGTRKKGNA